MPATLSATEITQRLAVLPGWSADGEAAIRRAFKFADHITAIGFVVRVAMAAEVMDHHPDLRIVYNNVEIVLSTHSAGGLTENDFALATKIDSLLAPP
jgi:4a-hydroxytetrahydrobiopterin dehydratase